jgi:hypothetical protein
MNPSDPLERELRSLCPRDASAELRRRIVDRLDRPVPSRAPESPRLRSVAFAGGLAAACLVAIGLWWSDEPLVKRGHEGFSNATSATEDFADLPTVLAYRHALVRSPDHFSRLLDHYSVVTLPHNPSRNGTRAFTRSDALQ